MEYYIYFLGLWYFAKLVTSVVTFDLDQGKGLVSFPKTILQVIVILPLAGRILNWW